MHISRSLWLAVVSAGMLACQASDRQVGSACRGGVCSSPTAVQSGLECLVGSLFAVVAVADGQPVPGLCLPRPLSTNDDGITPCRLTWTRSVGLASDPVSCDGPLLEPVPDDGASCTVRQLTPAQRDAGTEPGWFYSIDEDCPRVEVSAGTRLPEGGDLSLSCPTALTSDDGSTRAVDPELCAQPNAEPDPELVGTACVPSVIPPGGFDARDAYVDIPSSQCESGACLVYQLSGDPSSDCEGSACSTPEDVESAVYCSCRCNAPEGEPGPACECPDGFGCTEVIAEGPEGLRGAYCVRQ